MKIFGIIMVSFAAIIFICSCGLKTKLSVGEIKWFNTYNVGDTLIFKSETNLYDTTYIIKKELFYPNYSPLENHGSFVPQWAVVWYKNKNLFHHQEGEKLLTLEKKNLKDNAFIIIQYLNSLFIIENFELLPSVLRNQESIYELKEFGGKHNEQDAKLLYWHEKVGIVKYVTYGGITWNRINIRY